MAQSKADVLQGTLDLLVLKTLDTLGSMHGYGIAQRIQQVSEDALRLNQGTLYPALLRLEQRGWIASEWGDIIRSRGPAASNWPPRLRVGPSFRASSTACSGPWSRGHDAQETVRQKALRW
jgi:hypothetical protein